MSNNSMLGHPKYGCAVYYKNANDLGLEIHEQS
jgi:hypothetical protein